MIQIRITFRNGVVVHPTISDANRIAEYAIVPNDLIESIEILSYQPEA